jgi:cytochrome bd-type quinol oxidase subunit 2
MADREEQRRAFAFRKKNYLWLILAVGVVVLGFLLMIGGGDDDPNKFNKEELFSFRRLTLAPITILLGYALVMVAIMRKPREGFEEEGSSKNTDQQEGS